MLSARNRHRLFKAGFAGVTAISADRWLAPLARGRGVILTFHHVRPEGPRGFAPNALLAITPTFLENTTIQKTSSGVGRSLSSPCQSSTSPATFH